MIHIFLFLILSTTDCHVLYNQTKFHANKFPIMGLIEVEQYPVKVVFSAKSAFELTLYTTIGQKLYFKAKTIQYIGNPTYYTVNSIEQSNKITFSIYQIENDWFKISSIMMTIMVFFVVMFYKREHIYSQICLFVLLSVEILRTSDYSKIADRIFHRILF